LLAQHCSGAGAAGRESISESRMGLVSLHRPRRRALVLHGGWRRAIGRRVLACARRGGGLPGKGV
jgi:hypothetical protein